MEEETGVRLFSRGPRQISLTEEGLLLKRRAEELLKLVDKTTKELLEREAHIKGRIEIGCGEFSSSDILVELCGDFQKKYPCVSFHFRTGTARSVKEKLEDGLLDLGLLLEPVDPRKYEAIRMPAEERWGVLMRSDAALAAKESIQLEDLKGLPLIFPCDLKPEFSGEMVWEGLCGACAHQRSSNQRGGYGAEGDGILSDFGRGVAISGQREACLQTFGTGDS